MNCAECTHKECSDGKNCTPHKEEIESLFTGTDLNIMKGACFIEGHYYKKKTRIEETILFAQEMGYTKIGIAFCVGLSREAKEIQKILKKHFDVVSVCCKICGISKDKYDLEKIESDFEATCNPMGQATILNKEKTEFNIVIGLCVGHDTLFYKHCTAPVTTLVVKDRILAHNPLGYVYSGYY